MYKALKSFGGIVSMKKGDIKEINDVNIANDLLNAGYIKKVKEDIKNIETNIKDEIKKTQEEAQEKAQEEAQEETQVKKQKNSRKKK